MQTFNEDINKIDKPLSRFIKKERGPKEKKIRNEREVTTYIIKIQRQ